MWSLEKRKRGLPKSPFASRSCKRAQAIEMVALMKGSAVSLRASHPDSVGCRVSISPFLQTSSCRNPALREGLLWKQMWMRQWRCLKVQAVDAAQAFDFETKQLEKLQIQKRLKIGLVGFGNYGQFLAKRMVEQGHIVLAYSRSDYWEQARKMNVQFFRDADDFCEEHPEVIVLCTSILSTEAMIRAFPVQRLRRNTLVVDVLSVKEFPKNLLLQILPTDFDVLCTHPMFGPESGEGSWTGLPFVYEKVRVGRGNREKRCDKFLSIFSSEGCRMVEMSCEEHDRHAASSQFITHTVGRVLGKLGLNWTPINTKGYETLLDLVNNTAGDSFDLYYGLFMYNINATEELDRLELAFDAVKKQLFTELHNVLRSQLFDRRNLQQANLVPAVAAENKEPVSLQLVKHRQGTENFGSIVDTSRVGNVIELKAISRNGRLQQEPSLTV
ncbi:hypothetical protein GOP47_0010644 [Adiantum capillus-veneris]|uniref:Prephenate/arogenate dehydrogenase domain-containing protein n=1 Tax=Adiantum capillus-veneris TaxID=13818 RepID=A0A9D4UVB5_ADICA|nr:hypothetical protein GOP47_0010644 [Adiantum capillus-veneris]